MPGKKGNSSLMQSEDNANTTMPGKFTYRAPAVSAEAVSIYLGDLQVFHLCQEVRLRHLVALIQKYDTVNPKKST